MTYQGYNAKAQKAYRDRHPERTAQAYKRWGLKRIYGLTVDEFSTMLEEQQGCCACCRRNFDGQKIIVDHDHETGKIRGLLCDQCNRGIGLLQESILVLNNAANYLRKGGVCYASVDVKHVPDLAYTTKRLLGSNKR